MNYESFTQEEQEVLSNLIQACKSFSQFKIQTALNGIIINDDIISFICLDCIAELQQITYEFRKYDFLLSNSNYHGQIAIDRTSFLNSIPDKYFTKYVVNDIKKQLCTLILDSTISTDVRKMSLVFFNKICKLYPKILSKEFNNQTTFKKYSV